MGTINGTASRLARYWAEGRNLPELTIRGLARQLHDHLEHGAEPEHLEAVVRWMALEHPTLHDVDLAMVLRGAPCPAVVARGGHPCPCRVGNIRRGGAPAPALLRQLIRRPAHAA